MPATPSASTARKPRARPAARAPRNTAERPRIVVTGFNEIRRVRVCRRLGSLRAKVEQVAWNEALDLLAGGAAALVLVDPMRSVTTAAAVGLAREQAGDADLPVFVVVDEGTSSRRVLRLYAAGASAIFEWPREATVMADLFAESFGIVRVRGRVQKPDQALGRAVRARLRLYPELPADVKVFAQDGLVSVAGQVASLARCRELFDTIAAVPGVRGVVGPSMRVAAAGLSDRELRRRLRTLLEVSLGDGAAALEVAVRHGHVVLTGTVGDRAETRLLGHLLANVKGVRGLDLRVETTGEPSSDRRQIQRRLRRALAVLYPEANVDVDVAGATAILSGSVKSLLTKYSIERFAARSEGVRRVVDKIAVEP